MAARLVVLDVYSCGIVDASAMLARIMLRTMMLRCILPVIAPSY
jgi:hypothetical protein